MIGGSSNMDRSLEDIEIQRKLDSYKACFRDMILTMGEEIQLHKGEIKRLKERLQEKDNLLANKGYDVQDLQDKLSNLEDLYKQLTDSENNSDIEDPEDDLGIEEEKIPF